MRFSLLALAAILVPHTASAEAWRLAAYSGEAPKLAYFVDVDSIKRDGTKISFRQQTIYEAISPTRDFTRSMLWRDADCGDFSSTMRNSDFYVGTTFLGHEDGPGATTVAKAGSVLLTMLNTVCGRGNYFSEVVPGNVEAWVRGKFVSGF